MDKEDNPRNRIFTFLGEHAVINAGNKDYGLSLYMVICRHAQFVLFFQKIASFGLEPVFGSHLRALLLSRGGGVLSLVGAKGGAFTCWVGVVGCCCLLSKGHFLSKRCAATWYDRSHQSASPGACMLVAGWMCVVLSDTRLTSFTWLFLCLHVSERALLVRMSCFRWGEPSVFGAAGTRPRPVRHK